MVQLYNNTLIIVGLEHNNILRNKICVFWHEWYNVKLRFLDTLKIQILLKKLLFVVKLWHYTVTLKQHRDISADYIQIESFCLVT